MRRSLRSSKPSLASGEIVDDEAQVVEAAEAAGDEAQAVIKN